MSAPRVVAVAPGSPAERGRRRAPATRSCAQRRGAARRHRVPAAGRRGRGRARAAPRRARARRSRSRKRAGRAARRRGRTPRCSTGCAPATTTASSASSTSCRQGMRQSLYLKDDDYRLSFLYGNFTTLTRFTEADLERVVTERLSPAERQHPRHRPRRARRHAAQPAGRHEPALAAGPARPRHRGARPGRGVPRASTTAPCSTTRSPACSTEYPELAVAVRRAARRQPVQHRAGDAAAHRGRGRRRGRRGRGLAGRLPAPRSAAGWCSPPTSTTCWPAARSRRPSAYEGFPHARGRHRHGPHVRARVRTARGRRRRPASAGRVLRLGRRRARRGLPRAAARPRGTRRRRAACCAAPRRTGRRSSPASYGARVLAPLVDALGRDDVRVVPVAQRVLRRQHRRHRADGRRRPRPRARRRARGPPLPAARRVPVARAASSTAPRPTTCPARSRSSPPTASRCARALRAPVDGAA